MPKRFTRRVFAHPLHAVLRPSHPVPPPLKHAGQDLGNEVRSRLRKVKGLLRHKVSLRSIYSTVPLTLRPFLRAGIVPITGSLHKTALLPPLSHTYYTQEGRGHCTVVRQKFWGSAPFPRRSSKKPARRSRSACILQNGITQLIDRRYLEGALQSPKV